MVAKATSDELVVGEQLLTRYGGRTVLTLGIVLRESSEVTSHYPGDPLNSPSTVTRHAETAAYYGYSCDILWDVQLKLVGGMITAEKK